MLNFAETSKNTIRDLLVIVNASSFEFQQSYTPPIIVKICNREKRLNRLFVPFLTLFCAFFVILRSPFFFFFYEAAFARSGIGFFTRFVEDEERRAEAAVLPLLRRRPLCPPHIRLHEVLLSQVKIQCNMTDL